MKKFLGLLTILAVVKIFTLFVACFLTLMPIHAQTASQKGFLSIRESMDIVSYRRQHILDDSGLDGFIKTKMKKYDYRDQHFLEGIGTCDFWQYVKNGYVVYDTALDDYFIPYNKQTAATVAVADCQGIESIEGDETAIDVDLRVFSEDNFNILMREMLEIGFKYQKTENGLREYAWQSYRVYVAKFKTRRHDCWSFQVMLTKRDFGTTKHVEIDDSTKSHHVSIYVDYPVKGNPALLRRIRTFMMEAIEPADLIDEEPMPRFGGDVSDGKALVNYYGRKMCALLDARDYNCSPIEYVNIGVVGENDYYISFEVLRYGFYGGTDNNRVYGATFRKSDGKRLHVIANPQDPQYRQFLDKELYIEDRDALLDEYKNHIPLPEYEPYLIQAGVRFVYQEGEITVRSDGFVRTESTYSVMRPFLTDEVKDLLK